MPKHVMMQTPDHARKPEPRGYDYPVGAPVGSTAHVTVLAATALGQPGIALAQKCLAKVEGEVAQLQSLFGPSVSVQPLTLIVAPLSQGSDGTGGAYHMTCSDTVLYCDADLVDGDPVGTSTTLALFVAEAVEVFEAAQGLGWDCGASHGEGLSRVLAELLHPGVLDDYETASVWLDGGRPNWVDQTDATDQNAASTGCAVLFLTWLASKGFSWAQIAQAGAATLAGVYQKLTGLGTAWADFSAACLARWPAGQPSGVTSDNPWGAAPPAPPPPPAPAPAPAPAPSGSLEQQIQAKVDAAFASLEAKHPMFASILKEINVVVDQELQAVLGS